jgi:hypothetical protein
MTTDEKQEAFDPGPILKRRTTLSDDRYEIFYTFGHEPAPPHIVEKESSQPQTEPSGVEEADADV